MVLLHGTTGRSDSFRSIVPALSIDYRLFIPDLRGHGRSSHVTGNYRVVDFSHDICHLLEALCQLPVILLGHSLGGLVAIAVAAERPELVSALILEDAPLWLRRCTVKNGSSSAYGFFRNLHKLLMDTREELRLREHLPVVAPDAVAREGSSLAARLSQIDPDVLRMSYDSSLMAQFDIDRSLTKVQCPTLILQADQQQHSTLQDEDVHAALKNLTHGTHRVIAGAGHHIHTDQPQRTVNIIQSWLKDKVLL